MYPEIRVSLPITTFARCPGFLNRCATACPTRNAIIASIGGRFASPRIPSVPNSLPIEPSSFLAPCRFAAF